MTYIRITLAVSLLSILLYTLLSSCSLKVKDDFIIYQETTETCQNQN